MAAPPFRSVPYLTPPTTVGADADAAAEVMQWLKDGGVPSVELSGARDAITAVGPVAAFEKLFGVDFHVMEWTGAGKARTTVRAFRAPTHMRSFGVNGEGLVHEDDHVPHVPDFVARSVTLTHGLTNLPPPLRRVGRAGRPDERAAAAPSPSAVPTLAPGEQNVTQVVARGSATGITVNFVPMCSDGMPTADTTMLCSDHPPAISYVQVNATTLTGGKPGSVASASEVPDCTADATGAVSCSVSVPAGYYDLVNLTVQAFFGDGRNDVTGPVHECAHPGVSTPPITPRAVTSLYGIPPSARVTNATTTQAVVEFEEQYYSKEDLKMYMSEMGLPAPGPVTVVGPNNDTDPGGEANLDIQWIMGVAPSAATTFWSIKANSSVEIDDILAWATAMVALESGRPSVNSISYGMTEGAVDRYQGPGYVLRSDAEFMKLALLGVTIIIACGDTGAGDLGAPPMSNPTCDVLGPDWPSQSPYVLAIGSTYVSPNAEPVCYEGVDCSAGPLGEVVVSLDNGLFWSSGGGFSNKQGTASYQKDVVDAYLAEKQFLPPASMFNASGRAYPDAVAIGHNLETVLAGEFIPIDGTSASAPIFAGVMTLLNDARANAGMPPLGFANVWLYQTAAERPGAFRDVLVGNNRCGAYGWYPECCSDGFGAAPGWDAASGFGSPYYPVLLEEALKAGAGAGTA